MAGTTRSFGAGKDDIYLIYTNSKGDTLWTKTFGGPGREGGTSVLQTNDSGFIILGTTETFGSGDRDIYLVRTDLKGDTLWTKTYGGVDWESSSTIYQTNDNGFIISGDTRSFGAGREDFYLIRIDSKGDTLWTRTFGGDDLDLCHPAVQTTDGGFIVVGSTDSYGPGLFDIYIVRTNAKGDTLWTQVYGGIREDSGYDIKQTKDGGFIITGITTSYDGLLSLGDVILIRMDKENVGIKTKPYYCQMLTVNRMKNIKKVEIYDLLGKKVKTLPANADVGMWKKGNGVYVVRFVGEKVVKRKVVYFK